MVRLTEKGRRWRDTLVVFVVGSGFLAAMGFAGYFEGL